MAPSFLECSFSVECCRVISSMDHRRSEVRLTMVRYVVEGSVTQAEHGVRERQ